MGTRRERTTIKLTLDFDNNKIITEQGILEAPDLSDKKEALFSLLGLKEIPMEELRNDINNLFEELGLNIKA